MNHAARLGLALALAATTTTAQQITDADWPQFRGRFARGIGSGSPPTEWDMVTGKNIKWMTPIPGLAHSSPVFVGDRIFLTTAIRDGESELTVGLYGSVAPVENEGAHMFDVLCLDKASGEILWTKTAWEGVPAIKRHPKGSHAASTPATDGEHVVAFFGSEGLYCYDKEGELKWKKDFGVLDSGWLDSKKAQWGFASSPVIHEGRVYVQADVQDQSFVACFDVATGKEIWRTDRDEVPTWGTPTIDISPKRRQLILNGYQHLGGYDLDTGKELWKVSQRGGDIPVPTAVVAHDMAFLCNAHGRMAPILAISTAAEGEFPIDAEASEHMVWSMPRWGNYMQTPLILGDELYMCHDMGILRCFDAHTGELHYKKRLETGVGFTASGVAADGKLYFVGEPGVIFVVAAGPEYKRLAINEMGETCMATPAISQDTLFFRTRHHLVAVEEAPGDKK